MKALTDFDAALPRKLDTFEADEASVLPGTASDAADETELKQPGIAFIFNQLDRLLDPFPLRQRVVRP